jgi:hypothetical protein
MHPGGAAALVDFFACLGISGAWRRSHERFAFRRRHAASFMTAMNERAPGSGAGT